MSVVLLVGTVTEESTGEEHGLKESGWVQAGIRGLQKDSGLHQEIQGLCSIRDWRNFWGTKGHRTNDENCVTAQGWPQPGWVLGIYFSFPCC